MADQTFDVVVIGAGPGGYVAGHSRSATWPFGRLYRARESRRHLPQLGLYPDQGAFALGGSLSPHGKRQVLRPVGGQVQL